MRLVYARLKRLWIDQCHQLTLLHLGVEVRVQFLDVAGHLAPDLHGHDGVRIPGGCDPGLHGPLLDARRLILSPTPVETVEPHRAGDKSGYGHNPQVLTRGLHVSHTVSSIVFPACWMPGHPAG